MGEGFGDPADTWIANPPDVDITLTPERDVGTDCLRAVLRAYRENQSIDIFYQSMSKDRPEPTWRRVTPHAFGYDGFRWHIRAYCHLTDRFKDFLLPRILDTGEFHAAGKPGSDDALWQERFGIVIRPHPDLGPTQQAIVAKDYGMSDGTTVLEVRYAMLFYVLKRLNLLQEPEKKPARSQHIVVLNRKETDEALRRAEFFL
ncbi:WYL domain-containing protein [Roseovarius sp. D0-M9]|uniref:WYL domain-containing protein n=1 Tax=Roseovarius sp. D0-M9 TaxID=3127117 RepID=UPI00300F9EF8